MEMFFKNLTPEDRSKEKLALDFKNWVRGVDSVLDLFAVTHTADRFVAVGRSAPYYGHESSAAVMLASVPNDPHHWTAILSGRGVGNAYSRDVVYGNNHILAVGPDFPNKAGWGRASDSLPCADKDPIYKT